MKLLYISSATIPSRSANSIHVMKMCQAFSRSGHKVLLLAPNIKTRDSTKIEDVFEHYGVKKCFEIIRIPTPSWVPSNHLYGLTAALYARFSGFDLVYCRNNPAGIYSIIFNLPVIFEVHAPFSIQNRFFDRLIERIFQSDRTHKIVTITESLRKYLTARYPRVKEKILVAPDGADRFPSSIKPVSLRKHPNDFQVGYVGNLYPGKGMEVLSELAKVCPWANFHVVGGTDDDIFRWKLHCSYQDNIIFHGYISHSEVPGYIQAFDIVLLPNKNKVSTFGGGDIGNWTSPLKAFEYMSAGKAIVCSDLAVLREIFEHRRNAFLCPPDDIEAWASALTFLKDNIEERLKLGRVARIDFNSSYTWHGRASRILNGY